MTYTVVLGASTGTGAAVAEVLDGTPDMVTIGFHRGRHAEDADRMARELEAFVPVKEDVGTSYEAVQRGLDALSEWGVPSFSVKLLVHALSGASVGSVRTITATQVEKTFAVQAHSFLWWVQGLRERHLLAPQATLVALSNPVADNYLAGAGVIGPAKAALEAYVKALAVEMGREGHRVVCVRFGAVMTPALKKVIGDEAAAKMETINRALVPYGYMQHAAEIAAFIAWLAKHPGETWALNGAVIDFTAGSHLNLLNYAFTGGR